MPFHWTVEPRNTRNSALIIAGRDLSMCRSLGEALADVGVAVQRLVTRAERAEEIITRADAEGSVPVVVTSDARGDGVTLVEELLACDTLPGRPYLLVAPNDVVAAVAAETLEHRLPDSADRVLTITVGDLELASTRDLVRMHFSRACASYLGTSPRGRRANPAPVTDMPVGERVINNIERRAMQRGMFRVAALRVPRF